MLVQRGGDPCGGASVESKAACGCVAEGRATDHREYSPTATCGVAGNSTTVLVQSRSQPERCSLCTAIPLQANKTQHLGMNLADFGKLKLPGRVLVGEDDSAAFHAQCGPDGQVEHAIWGCQDYDNQGTSAFTTDDLDMK